MTLAFVREILGLGPIPKHRASAVAWLIRHGIEIQRVTGNGGQRDAVALAALPVEVRRALQERAIAIEGLDQGERDEDAHAEFDSKSPKMRAKAERLARIACFMIVRRNKGWTYREVFAAVRKEFGAQGTSEKALYVILGKVRGVAPINFAPVLMDKYTCLGRPRVADWDEPFYYALNKISDAEAQWPLAAAYDRLVAIKDDLGWYLPARSTFYYRWNQLPKAMQLTAIHGEKKAQELLRQSTLRDRDTIAPMQIWSLDGRKLDIWAEWEGEIIRPIELRLIDVATGKILQSVFCKTENSNDTAKLILGAVRQWGIPHFIYTDNSRAFSSNLVAGGADFKFRGKKDEATTFKPPSVTSILGINMKFAMPANGQAKLVERSFAETAKRIDCAPEFAGAHAGSRIDAKPSGKIKPVAMETVQAVFAREFAHHNARKRSGGYIRGRSFDEAFIEGLKVTQVRRASEQQLYRASLQYSHISVSKEGRVKVGGFVYGGPKTQEALYQFYDFRRQQAKEKIWVGVNPSDYSQPAVAYDNSGRPIIDKIEMIVRGEYLSQESAREAARLGKDIRKSTKAVGDLRKKISAAKEKEADAAYARNTPAPPVMPATTVIQPHFNSPLRERPTEKGQAQTEARIAKFLTSPKVEAR